MGIFAYSCGVFAQKSAPLREGRWIKIAITQTGFYQINQAWLDENKIGRIDPEKICIYGAHSGMLAANGPYSNGTLQTIPAFYQGKLGTKWQIHFWGESSHAIRQNKIWKQETNLYSDSTFYFVHIDAPKIHQIEDVNQLSPTTIATLPFAWSLKHYEPETFNLIQSGKQWLGDAFYGNSSKILQYTLSDYVTGQAVNLSLKLHASSISTSSFAIPALAKSITIAPILGGRYDQKVNSEEINTWIVPSISNNTWNWPIQYQSTGGTGYIDYISLLYPKTFDGKHENSLYLLPNTSDSTLRISIPNLQASQQIWIKNGGIKWEKIAKNSEFTLLFKPNSQLAILNLNQVNEPHYRGFVSNQNLFDLPTETQLLVISAPKIITEAQKLATYKSEKRGIPAKSISTEAIYHDFSGGKQDVTAIRNFIRYQYQKPNSKLKYVILLGDASIDYKSQNTVSTELAKSCFVPTFQSTESFHPLLSYASDDFFGTVGEFSDFEAQAEKLDIAIGRIPVKSPQEANMFIRKLIDYESKPVIKKPEFGWVADDGDFNIHMQDAEDFSGMLQNALFPVRQEKVYLDQYPIQSANGVNTSPKGTQAVLTLFNEKADFIHFMGHGSESGWTDEKLLTTNDLLNLKNNNHLPILLTATCQFGRFDDPNILSGGEVSLMSDQGGVIALISTTRPVFQSSNYLFGQAFYQAMLTHKENTSYRLGDLFRDAKNASQSGVINRNIQLLGDPTLSLPWSAKKVEMKLDLDKQEIIIQGLANQETKLYAELIRTTDAKTTLGNKSIAFNYEAMSPVIWKSAGKGSSSTMSISIKNMPSLLPNEQYQMQVWSANQVSGSIELPSWQNTQNQERISPQVSIELPEENLLATSKDPKVRVSFFDASGLKWLNLTGQIASMILDDSIRIVLAKHFVPEDATKGLAHWQLKSLKAGAHKIQVICWDIHNNQAEATLTFQVKQDDTEFTNGKIYPNPLGSTFHFVFPQDKPWNYVSYEVQLINLLGQVILVKSGLSRYKAEGEGIIEFDWTPDEWKQLNQNMIAQIKLSDILLNKIQIYRYKTTTLK